MKKIILIFGLLIPVQLFARNPQGATGIEVGYGKVSRNDHSASGTSWVYHFEFDVDQRLNFFGQAGQTRAMKSGTNLTQTTFAGGLGIDVVENLDFRVGAAIVDTHGNENVGALFGADFKIPVGNFLTGPSATYIRTSDDESAALRWGLYFAL